MSKTRLTHIISALERKETPTYLIKIISSYLYDRLLLYDTDEGQIKYAVTGGVPQGPLIKQVQIIGYVDDIAITIVAKKHGHLENLCNHVEAPIKEWLTATNLQLAG